MNRVIEPMPQEPATPAWPERNQRWLSERLAFWCERIARHVGDASPEETDPPLPPEAADGFEPAALRIGTLFGLSAFERELLVLAAGMEIDTSLRAVVARAQ